MRRWFGVVLACAVAYPLPAVSDQNADADSCNYEPNYSCRMVLRTLRARVSSRAAQSIPLQNPARRARGDENSGERCKGFRSVKQALHEKAGRDIERGQLGGHRAAVLTDGPAGSGHYWDLVLAVEVDDQAVGTCLTVSTAGWRNIPQSANASFPAWNMLAEDRFFLRDDLSVGDAVPDAALVPLVYSLVNGALVLDLAATKREIGRFAEKYAAMSTQHDDRDPKLHRVAAAAYRAYVADAGCPKREPKRR